MATVHKGRWHVASVERSTWERRDIVIKQLSKVGPAGLTALLASLALATTLATAFGYRV